MDSARQSKTPTTPAASGGGNGTNAPAPARDARSLGNDQTAASKIAIAKVKELDRYNV